MPKRITDPDFKYVKSNETDIRKTFERIRRQQRDEVKAREESLNKVLRLKTK